MSTAAHVEEGEEEWDCSDIFPLFSEDKRRRYKIDSDSVECTISVSTREGPSAVYLRTSSIMNENKQDNDPVCIKEIENSYEREAHATIEEIKWGKDEQKNDNMLFADDIWPGSILISDYLCANQFICNGKTVLELGAAGALPSCVAAKLGAALVVTTDYPGKGIIENIAAMFATNDISTTQARALPYIWGHSVQPLLEEIHFVDSPVVSNEHDAVLRTTKDEQSTANSAYLRMERSHNHTLVSSCSLSSTIPPRFPEDAPPCGFDLLILAELLWKDTVSQHDSLLRTVAQTLRRGSVYYSSQRRAVRLNEEEISDGRNTVPISLIGEQISINQFETFSNVRVDNGAVGSPSFCCCYCNGAAAGINGAIQDATGETCINAIERGKGYVKLCLRRGHQSADYGNCNGRRKAISELELASPGGLSVATAEGGDDGAQISSGNVIERCKLGVTSTLWDPEIDGGVGLVAFAHRSTSTHTPADDLAFFQRAVRDHGLCYTYLGSVSDRFRDPESGSGSDSSSASSISNMPNSESRSHKIGRGCIEEHLYALHWRPLCPLPRLEIVYHGSSLES